MIEFGAREIAIFLCIINWHEIQGNITLSPDPATVVQGQTLTLTCQSTQSGGTYQFYSQGTNNIITYGTATGSFKTCAQGSNPNFVIDCDFDNWIFNLRVSQPVHNLVIYCSRTLSGVISTSTTVHVQVPVLRVTLTPSSAVSVIEGIPFTFTCKAEASRPAANITWHLQERLLSGNDSVSPSSNDLFDVTSTLTLTFTKTDQSKALNCSANNIPGGTPKYSEKADLDVLYVPLTSPQLTAVGSPSADEGQPITLRCTLSTLGNPHITWSWVCGDDTLATGVTNTGVQSELRLTANRTYNQRTCQCRARTPSSSLTYDKSSVALRITVFYNNTITSNLNNEYIINEHGQLQIKCDVDGNPLSTITWLFVPNNTVVKRDSGVSSSSLNISSANCFDHGSYKVTAENGKGPADMRTTHVVVRCKPRLFNTESQTPDKLGIGNNESLEINVRMVLYPQATLTQWRFMKDNNNESTIIENTGDYSITDTKEENKQNTTLHKTRVDTEDFGEYTILVQNDVGNFTRIYHVDAARPPLIPTDLKLVCDTLPIKLSWISNFNGGDSQTFTISYSTDGDLSTSYKNLEDVSDKGYGRLHSYTPSIELRGEVWFTVTASNMFGESTSDTAHCFVKVPDENTSSVAAIAAGAAGGGIGLAVVVIVVVIFVRRNSKHGKQTGKSQRFRNSGGENEDADDDGLKENALYVSADIANDEKPGPSGMAVYAEVKKKSPGLSDNNANVYAEVKKTGPKVGEVKATNGAAKPKKGLFKKEEKPKPKKGKKQKPKQDLPDVYENSEDIAMKQRADDVYSNTGDNRPPKPEQRGYKNQDGLLYVEVQFDAKKDNGKPVIHGEDEKTDYATVEFPFPPPSQKAAEGEKKEK